MKLDPIATELFDESEEKHGELFSADTPIGKVYVRRATTHEFRRCVKKIQAGSLDAQDELCVACAIYPTSKELGKLFEKYPALSAPIAEVITEVAGGDEESIAKKPSSDSSSRETLSG